MSKRILPIFLAILAAFGLGTVALTAPAFAEEESAQSDETAVWLQISPVNNRVILTAGKTLEYNFTVENVGQDSVEYRVYAEPYSVINEDYDANFTEETTRTQISRWIRFLNSENEPASEATFTIGQGERQTLSYRIEVPESIPEGGQYAAIFAEPLKEEVETDNGVLTIPRVGMIIYGSTTGDTVQSVEFLNNNFQSFITAGRLKANTRVKNTGNTDIQVKYDFNVFTIFGKNIYKGSMTYAVLPDTTRNIDSAWENTPQIGVFYIEYEVSVPDTGIPSEKVSKVVLIIPIFVIIIVLLLLTFLIIWTIMLIRKRRQQKSKLIV